MSKTIVITGASSGIGRAAALALAAEGHEIVVVGRDPERTHEVAERIDAVHHLVDFDSIADVRRLARDLAERHERIDVLANNAGGLVDRREPTADGVDVTWQRNVLAPFVLTTELLPKLVDNGTRVLFTGSVAQAFGRVDAVNPGRAGRPWVGGWSAYGAAKRADIMLAKELAARTGLESYSFHPGFIASRFAGLDVSPLAPIVAQVAGSPEEGASPLIFLATAELPGIPNGTYFDRLKPFGRLSAQAKDPGEAAKLWESLERLASRIS
ncbi:SDR family oxidoreductase [Schumannella luteola]|uniref:NAD(P)-dependent dehydrogenase (Short-subunit alcohol dehydrogenase family) n=1 Tax=Schumannella luteola TaxID=472059 RepID=A0A852YQW7_9MICO|nr:SDR family NAD(P)-dependent oxidoreductase [Schumannella luteola]NYG99635.1 NAD(P)-dependent dehydrogenase (short-subunit alcohol dehydrogenase family) [Schumannella luteola]TPX02031.1 SDR family NAD(P)-dependent oxidoreductase [Schumannella luteola]